MFLISLFHPISYHIMECISQITYQSLCNLKQNQVRKYQLAWPQSPQKSYILLTHTDTGVAGALGQNQGARYPN